MPLQAQMRVLSPLNEWVGVGLDPISNDAFTLGVTEPTPSNTGPRTAPTNTINGNVTLSTAQTFSGNTVNGRIVIPQTATGTIIIEDNIINAAGTTPTSGNVISVHVNTGAIVIIRFNEIIGTTGTLGIGVRRFTAYRNYIHHVEDGIRVHNYNGTSVAASNTVIEGNCIGPLIIVTPDPNQARTDNRTHSDCIQMEGADGIRIVGNRLYCFATTDGTSNVEWAMSTSPYVSAATGTSGARPHPQASQAIMLSPNVSPITNFLLENNWIYGGEFAVNGGSSNNASSSGMIRGNKFDREQWHATWTIGLDSTAVNILTDNNTYMDDSSPVTVRRNA